MTSRPRALAPAGEGLGHALQAHQRLGGHETLGGARLKFRDGNGHGEGLRAGRLGEKAGAAAGKQGRGRPGEHGDGEDPARDRAGHDAREQRADRAAERDHRAEAEQHAAERGRARPAPPSATRGRNSPATSAAASEPSDEAADEHAVRR